MNKFVGLINIIIMLNLDIHLNILKYLDVYRWNKYINLNRRIRENILRNLVLVKKIFEKNKYNKVILTFREDDGSYEPHFILYEETARKYQKKWNKKYPNSKNRDKVKVQKNRFLRSFLTIDSSDWPNINNYDENIMIEIYRENEERTYLDSEWIIFNEVPYEYYVHDCYDYGYSFDDIVQCHDEFIILQHDKLRYTLLKIKYDKLMTEYIKLKSLIKNDS